jgi:hypothetical protein
MGGGGGHMRCADWPVCDGIKLYLNQSLLVIGYHVCLLANAAANNLPVL